MGLVYVYGQVSAMMYNYMLIQSFLFFFLLGLQLFLLLFNVARISQEKGISKCT